MDIFWKCYGEYKGASRYFGRYLKSCCRIDSREFQFKVYITDICKALAEINGAQIPRRYIDMVKPKESTNRNSEQVIDNIKMKLKSMEE